MKKLIILLLPLPAFAQISQDNGVCSTDIDGNTYEWACTQVTTSPPPPPPTPEPTYSRVVAFGDSWTNDNWEWAETVADSLSLPITNYATHGDTSSQIRQQVQSYVNSGVDVDALHFYWIFPNDYRTNYAAPYGDGFDVVASNVQPTFELLINAGVPSDNILVLTLPDGEHYPIFGGFWQSYGTSLTQGTNQIVEAAAVQYAIPVYDSASFLNGILDGCGNSCWLTGGGEEGNHMASWVHDNLAAEIVGDL